MARLAEAEGGWEVVTARRGRRSQGGSAHACGADHADDCCGPASLHSRQRLDAGMDTSLSKANSHLKTAFHALGGHRGGSEEDEEKDLTHAREKDAVDTVDLSELADLRRRVTSARRVRGIIRQAGRLVETAIDTWLRDEDVDEMDEEEDGASAFATMKRRQAVISDRLWREFYVYGLGSLSGKNSVMQLALMLEIVDRVRRELSGVVRDAKVSRPVAYEKHISALDAALLLEFGVESAGISSSDLSAHLHSDDAQRTAAVPTLIFMPHCPRFLYANILSANWNARSLRNLAMLGNSLRVRSRPHMYPLEMRLTIRDLSCVSRVFEHRSDVRFYWSWRCFFLVVRNAMVR